MTKGQPEDELVDLASRLSLKAYVKDVWHRRHFAVVVPANDIRAQNMDTFFGQLWHLFNPALLIGVYYVIFGVILDANRGVENFIGFLVVGVIIFNLSQRSLQDAAISLRRNQSLIRSIQFPRALLPISSIVGQTVAFFPSFIVMLGFLLATGENPSIRWIVILPILVAQQMFGIGSGLVLARIGYSFPDLQQLLPHIFRLLFYASGVLFSLEAFVSNQLLINLCAINPFYDICTIARWSLIGTSAPTLAVIGLLAWALVLPIAGLILFRNQENRYGA